MGERNKFMNYSKKSRENLWTCWAPPKRTYGNPSMINSSGSPWKSTQKSNIEEFSSKKYHRKNALEKGKNIPTSTLWPSNILALPTSKTNSTMDIISIYQNYNHVPNNYSKLVNASSKIDFLASMRTSIQSNQSFPINLHIPSQQLYQMISSTNNCWLIWKGLW